MKKELRIALLGNPNSGKTSLFNALTGLNQKVGNFPGVTVDRKLGYFTSEDTQVTLIDLPGTYSLYPSGEDERITARTLRDRSSADHPEMVLVVADFTNLRRSLVLSTQVMDLRIPVVLALNMADLADARQKEKVPPLLSQRLGVPVVAVSALTGEGLWKLRKHLCRAPVLPSENFFQIPAAFRQIAEDAYHQSGSRTTYEAWQLMLDPPAKDPELSRKLEALRKKAGIEDPRGIMANELAIRYDQVLELLKRENTPAPSRTTPKPDRLLLHPVLGYVVFVLILLLVFQAIFSWAKYPMDAIDAAFGKTGAMMKEILPEGMISGLLIDGLWAGLGGILVFIPQIAFLFMFISVLEDSGYMSRVVFLMDRLMKPFGFSGKSVIPLIGGMACAVPSVMMARSIPDKKERLITILVTPLMSCSARIPVYTLLIGMFVPHTYVMGVFNLQGLVMLALYFAGFLAAMLVAWTFSRFIPRTTAHHFVTELPLYRIPRWKNVGLTMWHKCRTFVVETGKIILIISTLLWFLSSSGPREERAMIRGSFLEQKANLHDPAGLDSLNVMESSALLKQSWAGKAGSLLEPVIRPLGFDWKIGISLITSFAAREVFVGTMATLYSVGEGEENLEGLQQRMKADINPTTGKPSYSLATAVALLLFCAFAMQCMSTVAVVKRETGGWKWAVIMVVYMTALAWLSAFAAWQILS